MNYSRESAIEKMRRGQSLLASGSNEEAFLGAALIALHGALEDRLRELLASRLPARRAEILDTRTYQWRDILADAEKYLGLPRKDSEYILKANEHRRKFAHGEGLDWDWNGIKRYEELILQVWANGSRMPVYMGADAKSKAPYTSPMRIPPRTTRQSSLGAPGFRGLSRIVIEDRPWYRSNSAYWIFFLFALPVWEILIFTDPLAGRRLKYAAAAILMVSMVVGVGLLSLFGLLPVPELALTAPAPTLARGAQQPTEVVLLSTDTPAGARTEQTPYQQPALSVPVTAGTPAACALTWEEYPGETLHNKNRAMVWTEMVSQRVSGSSMKAEEFFAQVVEHNPALKSAGYVFQAGETYLLPLCK